MLSLNFCCRLVYDICIILYYWVLAWFKSMLYWCFFWDFSCLWSFHKTTIASTVPNKVCKVATWCASDRADAFSTAPATHSGDLSFFPILISVLFLNWELGKNRLKEPTLKFHPQRLGIFLCDYFVWETQWRFPDFRHFFLRKIGGAWIDVGWLWPQCCCNLATWLHVVTKNFTTPTTPKVGGVDLRQARDRFQKFSELLHPKVALAKALSRPLKNFN